MSFVSTTTCSVVVVGIDLIWFATVSMQSGSVRGADTEQRKLGLEQTSSE